MINVLIITNELRHVCGISNHIKCLVNGLNEYSSDLNFILLCGNAESNNLKDEFKCKVIVDGKILHSGRSVFNFAKSVIFIKSLIKTYDINIIHSHNHYSANLSYFAARFTKTLTMQTNHGIIHGTGKLNPYKADKYIVLSKRIKNSLINKSKIKPESIIQINPGIQLNNNRLNKSVSYGKINVLAASRFVKEKGLQGYIKAANSISNDNQDRQKFYISGDGEYRQELVALNESSGNYVEFVDPLNAFSQVFEKANIFIYCSLSESEGVPAVILEAIANNCLVISSSFEGCKDIFSADYKDLTYEPDNINELIEKIEYAVNEQFKKEYDYPDELDQNDLNDE